MPIMKHAIPTLGMILACLFFAACVGVTPPQRPVAYMVPTVKSIDSLDALKPCNISAQEVSELLEKLQILNQLKASGMLDIELDVVARGLTNRGFAEIDARRAKGSLTWIAFSAIDSQKLEIVARFKNMPPKHLTQDLLPVSNPSLETLRACASPNAAVIRVLAKQTQFGSLELVQQQNPREKFSTLRWIVNHPTR